MGIFSRLIPDWLSGVLARYFKPKYLPPILCLLLSAFFWLLLTLNETVTHDFTLSVQVKGVPEPYGLISDDHFDITVSITGQAMELVRENADIQSRVTTIKLSDYMTKSVQEQSYVRLSESDLLSIFKKRFGSSIKVSEVKPKEKKIYFTSLKPFRVPVRLVKPQIVTNDYLVGQYVVPDSVTVYAIDQEAGNIHDISITNFKLDESTDGLSRRVSMPTTPGVRYEPDYVTVNVKTDMLISDSMWVDIAPMRLSDGRDVFYLPPKVLVRYTVLMSSKDHVRKVGFKVIPNPDFDYTTATGDSITLRLSNPDSSVVKSKLSSTKVSFVIQKKKSR